MKVDETDMKIMAALQRDGRAAFQEIANKLGISDATVYNRVQKLKKEGVIRRFTISIDEKKLGNGVLVCMGYNVDAKDFPEVIKHLKSSPYLFEVWSTTGAHNITARAVFKDFSGIQDFTNWVNSIPGVNKFDFTMVVDESKSIPRLDLSGYAGGEINAKAKKSSGKGNSAKKINNKKSAKGK